jgi:hypothetical protein
MALRNCMECGARISTTVAACPGCGAPIEVATGKADPAKMLVVLASLCFVGYMLWQHYAPRFASYQLRSGHFACPTEQAVVQVRGAGLLLGRAGAAAVAAQHHCIAGPQSMRVTRLSRGGVSTVQLGGRTMYVDHGSFERR